MQHKQSYARI